MEYAHSLQSIIEKISQKFQFDLTREGARYQLELSNGKALIIEVIDSLQINLHHQIARSHNTKVEIFTGWDSWVPVSVTLSDGFNRISAQIDRKTQNVDVIDPEGYALLNRGCRHTAMSVKFDFLQNEKDQPKVAA